MNTRICLSATVIAGLVLTIGGAVAGASPEKATDSKNAGTKTIGLVLTTWAPAIYQTADGKQECPDGLHLTNRENWQKAYPTQAEQDAFTRQRVYLGPASPGGPIPDEFYLLRGPHAENVNYAPTLVKDLPLREVQSRVAYGLNLDGKVGPEDFTSPEGATGIDNQLYRIYGCAFGWRSGGFNLEYHQTKFRQQALNRWLIQVTGVDNETNDDHVDVAIYKGIDRIVTDANLKPIVGMTHRIDVRFPKYQSKTTGKIVNGVLITDPVDHHYTLFEMTSEGRRFLRGLQLSLKLNETGATGLLAGYEDLQEWWWAYSNSYSGLADAISMWSPPAMYEAALRLADGYPDPKTGKNTAISTAYEVNAVRAFIVMPDADDPLMKFAPPASLPRQTAR